MRWIKWTMLAAAGCLPVVAFAEEAAKPAKTDESSKFGVRIEVQTDGNKPHVLVFGDDDSKAESKERQELVAGLAKQVQGQIKVLHREHERPHHKGTFLG